MRRITLLSGVVAVFASAMANTVRAATVSNEQNVPFSGSTLNACTGNVDTFSGFNHLISHLTTNNGRVHFQLNDIASDFKLEDATAGTCTGQASISQNIETTTSSLPMTTTSHTSLRFNCPGPGNNFDATEDIHVTINPDGTTVVSFDNVVLTCK
jgi:hypothetical protein